MPIPHDLQDSYLTIACTRCEQPINRKGSWFKVIATFRCPACNTEMRLGYDDKLRIFESYKHLAGDPSDTDA